MVGVNKCKEHNKKVDEDYEKSRMEAINNNRRLDWIYKQAYDNVFEDEEYIPYWVVSGLMMISSIPMLIYGLFIIPWIIAPTGSTIAYLMEVLG